jgi:excisionase family DNA binding protein
MVLQQHWYMCMRGNKEADASIRNEEETMSLTEIDKKRKCYTVSELAEILPLGRNSLYKLVGRSDFPKITVGRKILIPIIGLEKFLENNSIQ